MDLPLPNKISVDFGTSTITAGTPHLALLSVDDDADISKNLLACTHSKCFFRFNTSISEDIG
jgi:hypothetical protein